MCGFNNLYFIIGTAILGALKKGKEQSTSDIDYHHLAGAMAAYGGGRKPYLVCFLFYFVFCFLFFVFCFLFFVFCFLFFVFSFRFIAFLF